MGFHRNPRGARGGGAASFSAGGGNSYRGGGGGGGGSGGGGGRDGGVGGGFRGNRGNASGFVPGRPTAGKKEPLKFDSEYDFEQANEQFQEVLQKLQVRSVVCIRLTGAFL
jgi:hypothetical protein